jgi:hypothetical protein
MEVPSIVTFEVEAVKLDSEYERKHALRRLEKLRRLPRGKNSKVAKLPSLGPSDEGISIVYLHKNRPKNLHMSQPSQFASNA